MLEAIRDHAKGWIAKIILVLISIPFVLFGLESYLDRGAQDSVLVEFGDTPITVQEFDQEMQTQTQQLRERLGANFDSAQVQTPEFRQSVLDGLIERRVLIADAQELKLYATDSSVGRVVTEVPAFQGDQGFSLERYQAVLKMNNRSPRQFENEIRASVMRELVTGPVTQAAFGTTARAEILAKLVAQQREISWIDLPATTAIQPPDDKAIQAYYDQHRAEFSVPEAVQVEYAELRLSDVEARTQVAESAARAYFNGNANQFGDGEKRRASHILYAVAADADAAARAKAKARAEAAMATLKSDPTQFAALARSESEDPVSAEADGDLGSFARGGMVKPFEDAAFAMKVGEIRGPVQSDFGYHIIRLDAIEPASTEPYAAVRDQIVAQLKREQAQKAFPALAENFSNLAYENGDSLTPAAEAVQVKVQKTGGLTRNEAVAPFNTPALGKAIFGSEAIASRQNTEAIEVAPGHLVAARVIAHRPARVKPLADVRDEIVARLATMQQAAATLKRGEAVIKQLQSGKEAAQPWSAFMVVNRQFGDGLGKDDLAAMYKIPAAKVPGYGGYALPGGAYRVVRVSRVIEPALPAAGIMKNVSDSIVQATQTTDLKSWLAQLKAQHDIKVRKNALEEEE